MMLSKKTNMIAFALLLISCSVITNAFATHISKPILVDPGTEYTVGSTVILRGWVDYNEKPTPDVLLNFKVTRPDGTTAVDQSYPSNAEGQFEFTFDTQKEIPGTYQITITSHCLEIHRYACTYQSQTLPINLRNP